MITAYFGMAPALTYIPTRIQGKMTNALLKKYLDILESHAGFTFDKRYVAGHTVVETGPKRVKSYKYADYSNLEFTKEVKAYCNGEVNCLNLATTFLGLNGLFEKAPYKVTDSVSSVTTYPFLFGIVDHNSAHHMSWLLATRALKKRATKAKKIVLNFDAHYDYGASGKDFIHCSTWAVKLFETVGGVVAAATADAYVAIGVLRAPTKIKPSGDFETSVLTAAGQDKVAKLLTANTDTSKGASIVELLNEIEKKAGVNGTQYSVYITYDRDISKVSCTPYKDGQHEPEHCQAAVVNLIAELQTRGCEIVGFDVCGLPNTDGNTTVSSKTKEDGVNLAFSRHRR